MTIEKAMEVILKERETQKLMAEVARVKRKGVIVARHEHAVDVCDRIIKRIREEYK